MSSALPLLFQDDFIYVVNKPAGIHSVSNPRSPDGEQTVSSLVSRQLDIDEVKESGLVQRLDKYTSGCICGAKNEKVREQLVDALHIQQSQKEYFAVIEGTLKEPYSLDTWIGGAYRRSKKVTVVERSSQPKRFLKAKSTIEPIATSPRENISLARIVLKAARRHQVRAHCSYIGHPLVGDELYGATLSTEQLFRNTTSPLPQFLLHAAGLAFIHPVTNKRVEVRAPLPEGYHSLFRDALPGG